MIPLCHFRMFFDVLAFAPMCPNFLGSGFGPPSNTGSDTIRASPCLLPCRSLDTSFRLTNQCRTIFSAPILLTRPTSSSHFGACLSTLHLFFFFFAAQLGLAPVTLLPSTPHTRALLPMFASEAYFSRPAVRPHSCPPPPALRSARCTNVAT